MKKLFLLVACLSSFLFAEPADLATKARIKELIEEEAKSLPTKITEDGNMILADMKYDMENNSLRLTALLNSKYFTPKEGDLEKLKKVIAEQVAPEQQKQICNDFPMITMLFSDTLIKYEYVLDNMQEPFFVLNVTKKTCGYTGEFQIIQGGQ